jgi:hypothetical protein
MGQIYHSADWGKSKFTADEPCTEYSDIQKSTSYCNSLYMQWARNGKPRSVKAQMEHFAW